MWTDEFPRLCLTARPHTPGIAPAQVYRLVVMTELLTGTTESAWPVVTRMLLRADDSMTKLLEALLGEPLFLDALDQRRTTAAELSGATRSALRCRTADRVILRRSLLTTDNGRIVSEHSVAIMAEHELAAVLTDERTPIGHSLSAAGRYVVRTILTTGVTTWTASGQRTGTRCAYRECVLEDHAGVPVAYMHEKVAPAVAPLEKRAWRYGRGDIDRGSPRTGASLR